MTYIYPKLPATYLTTPYFRLGGNGLANCLYVYARAIVMAKKFSGKIITPPWFNVVFSGYIHHRQDKRHYLGLFKSCDEIIGIKKLWLTIIAKKSFEDNPIANSVVVVEGLGNYFKDILEDGKYVGAYIYSHLHKNVISKVDAFDFSNCVAVHVRLGDYAANRRTPLEWYAERIKEFTTKRVLLFSDGTEEELKPLLDLPNVERSFFGNAIADIFAISRCEYVIGSDSTFSGWGAYLGQVPCRFYKKHYGPVLKDSTKEIIDFV